MLRLTTEKIGDFVLQKIKKKKIKKKYSSNDKFRIFINSSFNKNGNLNYGELLLKGKSKQEILISTYICHPSMANDELSGTIVSLSLIKYFQNFKNLSKTLRFIFVPETIGSIAFLYKNINELKSKTVAGYNITCIGDERTHSCIFSKYKNTQSDDALIKAYKKLKIKYKSIVF